MVSRFSALFGRCSTKYGNSNGDLKGTKPSPPRRVLRLEPLEDRRLLAGTAAAGGQSQTLADLPVAAQYAVSASLGKDMADYRAAADAVGWTVANPANNFSAEFRPEGFCLSAGADDWRMSLREVGYGAAAQTLPAAQLSAHDNRVDYDYGLIDEWYVNGPLGLQQGFTVRQRPTAGSASGGAPLTVTLGLEGDLHARASAAGDALTLTRPDGSTALSYGGLTAYDATGRVLTALLEVTSDGGQEELLIHVADAGAVSADD